MAEDKALRHVVDILDQEFNFTTRFVGGDEIIFRDLM